MEEKSVHLSEKDIHDYVPVLDFVSPIQFGKFNAADAAITFFLFVMLVLTCKLVKAPMWFTWTVPLTLAYSFYNGSKYIRENFPPGFFWDWVKWLTEDDVLEVTNDSIHLPLAIEYK